jgi:hypothetical protein
MLDHHERKQCGTREEEPARVIERICRHVRRLDVEIGSAVQSGDYAQKKL